MKSTHLSLTIDEFLAAPQELVLRHRHGRSDRRRVVTVMGAEIPHAMKEALRSREIHCDVTVEVCGTAIRLNTEGFHEHGGRLCRIFYLSRQDAELRRNGPMAQELELLTTAGWVAEHYFARPPKGLRLYYHVFRTSGPNAEICESWYREYPLAPESEIRQAVAKRTARIAEALTQPDEELPECTVDERNGALGSEYSKCRDWCPARAHCQQIERYYAKQTERSLANERALASIIVGESLTFAERQAADRKKQISAMLMAGNFFENDFPREVFRKLILEEAEDETTEPEKSSAYREMATSWSDAKFVTWRDWLDRQD